MSDDIKEAAEFNELVNNYKPKVKPGRASSIYPKALEGLFGEDDKEVEAGQPTQYALYGGGYSPMTPTTKLLPPGCYNINLADGKVYVTPALPPSGLLLELPEMRSEDLIKTIESFWNSEKDYKEGNEFVHGGVSYKAGVLLYGPGGSGKSSCIKIASKKLIERGGTVFYSSGNPMMTSMWLESFARIEPNRKSIVILEDIDSLIENYGESQYLEMLDSAKSIDNVLFIATTNYPEKLDPRIYNRPGRFSHIMKVGAPTPKMREAFLKAILKNHKDVEEIVDKSSGFTIDHLNSLVSAVYREKKELRSEIERLRTLFNVPKVEEKTMGFGLNVEGEE